MFVGKARSLLKSGVAEMCFILVGSSLQPSFMLVGKAKSLLKSGVAEMCFILEGSSLQPGFVCG